MDPVALEKAIGRIPGVEAVRVVTSAGEPSEVHVLSRPGKPPKQVVRDVQSVALAQLRVQLDRRIVSVVQLDQDELGCGIRPALIDHGVEIDGSRCTTSVTLTWHEQRLVGKSTGPSSSATHLRQVAEATVAAVELAVRDDAAIGVAAVDTVRIGSHSVAVVILVAVVDGTDQTLSGSAILDDDPARSVVRAVLDALNRRLPDLKRA